jgi:uncharacterized membrane protein YphA (DoxX/SURF4 family)
MNLQQIKSWLHSHPDVLMDLIRLYLGVALFFKGLYFMSHGDEVVKLIEAAGPWGFAPAMILHYTVLAHVFGGLMLAAGLFTRIAALAQLPTLLGAVFYIHLPRLTLMSVEHRQNFELSALVLFLTMLVLLHGAGRFSLDHALEKRTAHGTTPAPNPA